MEPGERIRQLRKKFLRMSLADFSNEIHISGSNLGNIETGRIGLTERVLLDICRTFHVRQEWIENGDEPVFEENHSRFDASFLKQYQSLTEDHKKYLYGYMQRLLEEEREMDGEE